MLKFKIIALMLSFTLGQANAALLFTDFTAQEEGQFKLRVEDNGIIFTDPKEFIGDGGDSAFVVQGMDAGIVDVTTSTKQLAMGSYYPGTDLFPGYGSFGSANIGFDADVANNVSMKILDGGRADNNVFVLEALFDNSVVASSSIMFTDNGRVPRLQTLSISGVNFDSLRLVTQGTGGFVSAYIGIDSVLIETGALSVPEPSTAMLFSMLVLVTLRRKLTKS